jgi:hypothetical protein
MRMARDAIGKKKALLRLAVMEKLAVRLLIEKGIYQKEG